MLVRAIDRLRLYGEQGGIHDTHAHSYAHIEDRSVVAGSNLLGARSRGLMIASVLRPPACSLAEVRLMVPTRRMPSLVILVRSTGNISYGPPVADPVSMLAFAIADGRIGCW